MNETTISLESVKAGDIVLIHRNGRRLLEAARVTRATAKFLFVEECGRYFRDDGRKSHSYWNPYYPRIVGVA